MSWRFAIDQDGQFPYYLNDNKSPFSLWKCPIVKSLSKMLHPSTDSVMLCIFFPWICIIEFLSWVVYQVSSNFYLQFIVLNVSRFPFCQAYESLSDGLGRTASVLVGNPFKTYQRGGGAGPALATAVRAAPAAVMAPVSASARAVHCALVGVRNRSLSYLLGFSSQI